LALVRECSAPVRDEAGLVNLRVIGRVHGASVSLAFGHKPSPFEVRMTASLAATALALLAVGVASRALIAAPDSAGH
jgi:hypothetical protein